MPDRSYLPYYYGLNYDAPAEPEVPVQPVGAMLGSAYRQGAIGVDSGLWYQKLTGMPLDASRFQMVLGGDESGPEQWLPNRKAIA